MVAKSKAQLMKETRQRRKDAGLVEFRVWVTVDQQIELMKFLHEIKTNQR